MSPSHACLATTHNEDAAWETTAGDVLIDWARRTPYRAALTEAGAPGAPRRSWTCEALRDDAATLAVALLSRFAPGERIAVWAPPSPEAVLLQFAAAFAGLTLATIDPACRVGELTGILDQSGAVGLFMMSGKWGRTRARRRPRGAMREFAARSLIWRDRQAPVPPNATASTALPDRAALATRPRSATPPAGADRPKVKRCCTATLPPRCGGRSPPEPAAARPSCPSSPRIAARPGAQADLDHQAGAGQVPKLIPGRRAGKRLRGPASGRRVRPRRSRRFGDRQSAPRG